MYTKDKEVKIDTQETALSYKKMAEQGNTEAQIKLGYMYSKGEGVEQNHEIAIELYKSAIEQEIKLKMAI